jgi:hypothetical protein
MKGKSIIITVLFAALLNACGGGTPRPLFPAQIPEYDGIVTEAGISGDNAQRLIREMFGLADPLVEQTDSTLKPAPYNLLAPLALTASIEKINDDSLAELTIFTATNFNDLVACDAGDIDYSLLMDNLTGEFNGFIDYRACLISDLRLSGTADISGVYDRLNHRFLQISLGFPWLTGEAADASYLASGFVDTTFAESTQTTLTGYAVIIDGRETVKFEAFTLDLAGQAPNQTLALSGSFYQPEHGFVTVSNPLPLLFTADTIWPLQGQTRMDGLDSSLRIETEDSRTFTLWVDEDGDGVADLVSLETW